jgi:hypothetical protein
MIAACGNVICVAFLADKGFSVDFEFHLAVNNHALLGICVAMFWQVHSIFKLEKHDFIAFTLHYPSLAPLKAICASGRLVITSG